MPTWNPQQYSAIHTKHKNVIVSASAGAGKTTVLIARLVNLVIHQHIGIEHILAMTFTEAAANEMKKRLAAELHHLYTNETDEAMKQYISEQLTAIQNAHISTIHSFCLSILQEYYYTIGLSANMVNTIMSTADAQIAKVKAMDMVFEKQYKQNDEAFYRLTSMFSTRAESNDELKKAIMTLATSANAQSDPMAWLHTCSSLYRTYPSMKDLPKALFMEFIDDLTTQFHRYVQTCEAILDLYSTRYWEESKKIEAMNKKWNAITALYEEIENTFTIPMLQADQIQDNGYAAFREAFIGLCHSKIPTSPNTDDNTYKNLRDQATDLEDELLAILYEEQIYLNDIAALQEPIAKLTEMCCDYLTAFSQIKLEMQCIDFDDMEHFALRILTSNHGLIADHYRNLFDEIMVDEFQDSNDVQNELVNLICRGNNVFRVGDIKQSIYGFRHAKPQLMRGLIDHAGQQDEVIYLSNNYRSKKMIVDFNNILYKELMNLQGFSSRYASVDEVSCGIKEQEIDNVPIIFHALNAKAIAEECERPFSNDELKASYIASQIVKIKEEEHKQWKDFVVLVRSNERKGKLKRIFDQWNIPSFINIASGFYQSNAIQIVLSACNALMDPNDEISFVATMLSPLFQISVQELSDIRLKKGNDSYYAYMLKQQHPIMETFEHLRSRITQAGICESFNALYALHHFYDQHTSSQERTNLDYLFEQAIAYEQEEGKDLLSFIRSINEIKHMESGEAMPIGSEDDVVRVMSIHQSKGLQFPVVFLWSSDTQSGKSCDNSYLCDSELGLGMTYMDIDSRFMRPTLFHIAMKHKQEREALEEEMRVLYVATTRSQQQLHIVDFINEKKDYTHALDISVVYGKKGYTSWILHSKLAQEASHLFHIKPVSHLWQEEIQPKQEETVIGYPLYQQKDPIWEIVTPSAIVHAPEFVSFADSANEAMQYGTRMHAYIEALPKGIWSKQDFARLTPAPSSQEQFALQKLNENMLFQKANTYAEVFHEMPFMVRDHQQILHGYMDFVAIDHDIIIIDFKTDAINKEQELTDRYRAQLLSYEKAMHILYPDKQVTSYLYSFKLHKEIRITPIEIPA